MVGIDVLFQLLQGSQTDHRLPAEPEGGHWPKVLVKAHQEVVQAASIHNVLQVPVPGDRERICRSTVYRRPADRLRGTLTDQDSLVIGGVQTRDTRGPSGRLQTGSSLSQRTPSDTRIIYGITLLGEQKGVHS